MAKVTVNKISTDIVENYSEQDLNLIPSFDVVSQFNPETDVVEFSVYNEQNLLEYINYNYIDYTITLDYSTNEDSISSVNVDPEKDLVKEGFDQGNYTVIYNFLRNQISSSFGSPYYVKEISSDRTELRIANNNLANEEIENLVTQFKEELTNSAYFEDFEVNFGNNNIYLANNILVDTTDETQYTVLIKLYEPLETQFEVKDTLTIVLQTANETSYQVNFPPQPIPSPTFEKLKGPNFNLDLNKTVNNSTTFVNKQSLFSAQPQNPLDTPWSSSLGELKSILEDKGITPNIDYTDFNNFVYFSSAEERVKNFYYKVGLIQQYSSSIAELKDITNAQSSGSIADYQTKINSIIENFDGYEKYQYYSSGSSDVYPKINDTKPYLLALTGSSDATDWLEDQATNSGSIYDLENDDRLVSSLPNYVKDDTRNSEFLLFMDMIGHHFDNIWVYTTDIGNRFDADNRLRYGISKDIVADAIKSMGVNLYQNNFTSDNLLSSFTGLNPESGSLFPTGSEVINTVVTASNSPTVIDDVNKEFYKRIFHNLPLLLKQKGSVAGIRNLINTFGVPDTVLRISEFGGKDKDNTSDHDYYQSKFNYAMYNSGSSTTSRFETKLVLNNKWGSQGNRPETVLFRFKPDSLPTQDTYSLLTTATTAGAWNLTLEYTGSGYTSASYSGSIPSESRYDARLVLWDLVSSTEVDSLSAPFYNGNWWTVAVTKEGSTSPYNINLIAAENLHHGDDGYRSGRQVISSTTNAIPGWNANNLFIPASNNVALNLGGNDHYGLTGSFQEVRLYNTPIDKFTVYELAANPHQIIGETPSSSAENLVFRAPLGAELDISTGSLVSVHPKITGSFVTNSFASDSDYEIEEDIVFVPNKEFFYYEQPAVGIKNRIKEKVRSEDLQLPFQGGDTLSPIIPIQQDYLTESSGSYSTDTNLVEIAFSPQNEINDDINNSFGYFNIGDYIGDPRQISESVNNYPDLDLLRDTYFGKYYKNYNWKDYIRLIKFFDNSLFKMIKDFTPTKASLSTGVVIKQHILERNKYRPPAVETSLHDYSGSIESGFASGSGGGVFNDLDKVSPQVTQSWDYAVSTPSGSVTITQSTQDEFYNGELSGSEHITTDGELTLPPPQSSILDAFERDYTAFYVGLPSSITQPGGEGAYLISDINKGKFTILGLSSNDFSDPIQRPFLKKVDIGDTITVRVASVQDPAPVQPGYYNLNDYDYPSTSRAFTITSKKSVNGGFVFGIDHSWDPNDFWYALLFNAQDGLGAISSGLCVLTLIYDGEPIGKEIRERNPITNNVNSSRLSTIYEDIDYSSNTVYPTNFNLLASGSAQKAPIQDSNYTKKSWINGRYNGSRISSLGFNIEIQK